MKLGGESKIILGSALFALIPMVANMDLKSSVFALIFGRVLIASIVLFIFQKNRKQLFKLTLKQTVKLFSWSLLMAGAMITYFYAIDFTGISISSALLGTQPLFIVLLALFLFREKITRNTCFSLLLSVFGIILISNLTHFQFNQNLTGQFLAIGSAVLLALNFILQKKFLGEFEAPQLVFYQSLFQIPVFLPLLFLHDFTFSMAYFHAILILGLFCTVLAYILIYKGTKQVDAQKIGVLQSVEYVLPVFIGAFLYHEELSFKVICGVLLIITACILIGRKTELKVKN